MKARIAVLVVCLFAMLPTAAFAEGYVGFGLGAAQADVATSPTAHESDTASQAQLIVGYSINRHWSIEAGYTDFSETSVINYEATSDSTYLYRSVQSTPTKRSALSLSAVAKLPLLTDPEFSVYLVGRVGAAYWKSSAATTNNVKTYLNAPPYSLVSDTYVIADNSETGFDPVLALGLAINASKVVTIRVEYSRYVIARDTVKGIATTVLISF